MISGTVTPMIALFLLIMLRAAALGIKSSSLIARLNPFHGVAAHIAVVVQIPRDTVPIATLAFSATSLIVTLLICLGIETFPCTFHSAGLPAVCLWIYFNGICSIISSDKINNQFDETDLSLPFVCKKS